MNKYGILGWPLERSYSPVIHTFLFKHASLEGKYELIKMNEINNKNIDQINKSYSGYNVTCLLYTSPSPRDLSTSRMPSSA